MRCETTADPAAMWDLTSGFLLADPVANNVLATNIAARREGAVVDPAPATYATVFDEAGKIVGTAMRTPPFMVSLSPMPVAAVAPLAAAMVQSCPDAVGVNGPDAVAEAFATAWTARTGAAATIERHERLYRLAAVVTPPVPPGRWRTAAAADRDLLVAWFRAFEVEVGLIPGEDVAHTVDSRVAAGLAHVWDDGGPVCFACATRPAGAVVRIGPVYTPPDRRRRGYAAALVADVSQRGLDDGAEACILYTDLANPTSNGIYMAVGYRPVGDVTAYRFARSRSVPTSASGTRGG